MNCDSSVSLVTRLGAGRPDFDNRQGRGFFCSPPLADQLWGPPSILPDKWIPEALSPKVKRPGLEAVHSPPSSGEVKYSRSYISTPPYIFMTCYLVKQRVIIISVIIIVVIIISSGRSKPAGFPYRSPDFQSPTEL
jgi:hypothetical protein